MATATIPPLNAAEAETRFYTRYGETVGGETWPHVQAYLGPAGALAPQPATVEDWIAVAEVVRERARQSTPPTLPAIAQDLAAPFPYLLIELKPGALNREKTRALAMPYADLRAYEYRLDEVAGAANWSSTYEMGPRGIVCALTICGVTKSGVGDYPIDTKDENAATSAQAQAFKRACSAFGIGRYLYDLPKTWCAYDDDRKQIVNAERVVWDLYRSTGLLTDDEARTPPPTVTPRASGGGR